MLAVALGAAGSVGYVLFDGSQWWLWAQVALLPFVLLVVISGAKPSIPDSRRESRGTAGCRTGRGDGLSLCVKPHPVALFHMLKADRRLLLLPAAALLLDVCCAGVLLGLAASVSTAHNHKAMLVVAFAVGLYPFTVSSTFFNVALMHVVSERWQGRQASVVDGLLLARRRLRVISNGPCWLRPWASHCS